MKKATIFTIGLLFICTFILACNLSNYGPRGKRLRYGGAYIGSSPSMSFDGKKIVFGSTRYGLGDICSINSDGSNWTRLTNTTEYEGEPEFSPDGKKIVFVSERDGNGEIYIMNSDGSNQTRLTNYKYYDANPSFSPDGSKIIYAKNIPHPNTKVVFSHLFIMNSDGSNSKRITYGDYWFSDPSFSPDGQKIIYKTGWYNKDDNIEIRIGDIDHSNEIRLTERGLSHDPSFSSDGDEILFISDVKDEGDYELFKMDYKKSVIVRIPIPKHINVDSPTYVYNNKKIMFLNETNEKGGQICIINTDGTGLKIISNTF